MSPLALRLLDPMALMLYRRRRVIRRTRRGGGSMHRMHGAIYFCEKVCVYGALAEGGHKVPKRGTYRTYVGSPRCGSTHTAKARKKSGGKTHESEAAARTGRTRGAPPEPTAPHPPAVQSSIRRPPLAPTGRGDTEPPPHPWSLEPLPLYLSTRAS